MIIQSIRRVTDDARHNAFTGACWFKGHLYLAYRQGDAHCCAFGRIVVLRSRDEGLTWDHVAVARGPGDTRDAHLYTDGRRLYVVGFCIEKRDAKTHCASGCAWTENGDIWTPWTPYKGTADFIMWRPEFFDGKHYCAAYSGGAAPSEVHWFESADGRKWTRVRQLLDSTEQPSECHVEFRADGRATMLMRCDSGGFQPYLLTSQTPFASWEKRKLTDITMVGAAVWTVDDDIYIGGRWCFNPKTGAPYLVVDEGAKNKAHTAIFRVTNKRTMLQAVLPSGPRLDHSYLGVARYPNNPRRFAISFYGDAVAPATSRVDQWTHPDIYLADVLCDKD